MCLAHFFLRMFSRCLLASRFFSSAIALTSLSVSSMLFPFNFRKFLLYCLLVPIYILLISLRSSWSICIIVIVELFCSECWNAINDPKMHSIVLFVINISKLHNVVYLDSWLPLAYRMSYFCNDLLLVEVSYSFIQQLPEVAAKLWIENALSWCPREDVVYAVLDSIDIDQLLKLVLWPLHIKLPFVIVSYVQVS